jgi:hypothetical protein
MDAVVTAEPEEALMIDWREIDLDGVTVEGLTNACAYGRGVLVWGRRGGRPYAARRPRRLRPLRAISTPFF